MKSRKKQKKRCIIKISELGYLKLLANIYELTTDEIKEMFSEAMKKGIKEWRDSLTKKRKKV